FLRLLQLAEQAADAIQVFGRRRIDEVGVAAYDQDGTPGMILAPGGEARGNQLGGGRVDRFLAFANLVAKPSLRLRERQSGEARVDEVADLVQRRRARAADQRNHAVFHAPVDA